MKTELHDELNPSAKTGSFARRSYRIYLEHFKSRNLTPALTMEEFMENYRSE